MRANRYDRFSAWLHWCMALLIMGQIGLGLWMQELPKDQSGVRAYWFNVHKSLGMVLLLLVATRVAWVPFRPAVKPVANGILAGMARLGHMALYLLMVLAPLSGLLGSIFSPYPIRWFGLLLPRVAAPWESAKTFLGVVHAVSTWALIVLVVAHLCAFAYHQWVRKDALLQRMSLR